MKYGFVVFLAALLITAAVPLSGRPVNDVDAYTRFAMGVYYLYEGQLATAREQFLLTLRTTTDPPALLYTILSEISDMMGEQKKAREYAFKALEVDPENEMALSMAALFLISEREYAKASEYLETLNRKKPEDLQTLYYLAEAFSGLGNEDKLLDLYPQILRLKPELVEVRLNLAYLYTKKGDFFRAKVEYRKALEQEPENEKAIFYLTYIYLSEGNADEASALFKRLDEKNLLNDEMLEDYVQSVFAEGQDPRPIVDRIRGKDSLKGVTKGILSFLEGDYDEAKSLFEKELESDAGSIPALTGLVRIAEKKGNRDMEAKWRTVLAGSFYDMRNLDEALDQALKVRDFDPQNLENRYLLGEIYQSMGKKKEALVEYEHFRDRAEEKGDIYLKLAFLYDEMKNHGEAANNFLRALELQPDNAELLYYLGIEYRILGDHEKAAKMFTKAVELDGQNALYHFYLGASLERLGRIDEAIRSLERSVQLNEKNPAALNYLGYLLADRGVRLADAKTFITMALGTDPENGAYLDSMGWVYYKQLDYQKAREYLESAVRFMDETEAENYLIYDHLGDAYRGIGMLGEALDAWGKALKLKDVEDIRKKKKELEREINK